MPPLLLVAIVVFLEVVCLGAVIPSLTPFTESLGGSALLAGVMFALVSGPKIIMNPLWGHLSDHVGRKPLFILLTIMTICGSLLWWSAESLAAVTGITALLWLGVSRLLHGIFSAQATIAFSVASDTSAPEKRAAAMGVLGAAFGAGLTVGFPIGGIIATWNFAYVGLFCAGCELIALGLLVFVLKETRELAIVDPAMTTDSPWRLIRRPAIAMLAGVCILTTIGLSVMTPTFSPYLADLHGFSTAQIGWAFFVFGIVSIIIQGGLIRPVVKRLGEKPTFILGTLILAIGFILIAIEPPLSGMWAGTVLIGVGAGLSSPTLAALFSLAVTPREQGAVHGLNQGCTALGRTISYPLAGGLYERAIALPYWAGAAALVIGLIPLAWVNKRERSTRR